MKLGRNLLFSLAFVGLSVPALGTAAPGPGSRTPERRLYAEELVRKRKIARLDKEIEQGERDIAEKSRRYGIPYTPPRKVRIREPQHERDERAAMLRSVRKNRTWLPIGEESKLPRSQLSAPEMKSFEKMVSHLAEDKQLKESLDDVQVIGIQHLLGTTGGLMRGLAALGVKRQNIHFIGKTYSQHEGVIDELNKDGFAARASSFEGRLDLSFKFGSSDSAPENRTRELMDHIDRVVRAARSKKSKILVVDDGGELLEVLHHAYPELHDRIVGVAQTRKDIFRLRGVKLKFPVIDVAQSWGKLTHESPMIGHSIAASTHDKLESLKSRGVDVGNKITVIGYGAVGHAAVGALKARGYEVEIYDKSTEASEAARKDPAVAHVHTSLPDALRGARVVVSMTGQGTLTSETLEHMPQGAVLINAASSSTEFLPDKKDLMHYRDAQGRTQMRLGEHPTLGGKPFDSGKWEFGERFSRQDWVITLKSGKELVLANQGSVINFDGKVDPIPARYIQLTRGLLLLGAVQATRTTAPGIHALEEPRQRTLVEDINRELSASGESLAAPRF